MAPWLIPLLFFLTAQIPYILVGKRAKAMEQQKPTRRSTLRNRNQSATRTKIRSVSELRNGETGRLDAGRIAEFFGLTLKELACLAGSQYSDLRLQPDMECLQVKLCSFERVVSAARFIVGDENAIEAFKVWLNTKTKSLGDSPIKVIRAGKIDMLADWLEDAILGLAD